MRQLKCRFVAFCSVLGLGTAILLVASKASAQTTSGAISGLITDSSTAGIPGAAVAVRNLDTNASRNTNTDLDGRFRFPGLQVGRYELTVEAKGFSKIIRGPIQLVLNQEAVLNAELQPAAVQETVT